MSNRNGSNWDPFSVNVQRDQRSAYDEMREHCPVAYSASWGWSVFRHADIMDILHDSETFSNNVSSHTSVPNGMDPPEHTQYRKLVEVYFEDDRIAEFEPKCRGVASDLVDQITGCGEVEFIDRFARTFAVRVQCAFMSWPKEMHQTLREWTINNIRAIRNRDRPAIKRVARRFQRHMKELLSTIREADPDQNITAHLLHQKVNGQRLTDEEIISILRNWTMGEVGTITNAIGILVHFIAARGDVQSKLRAETIRLEDAIEEILRLYGPLVTNRRKTRCPVNISGRRIEAGETITTNWVAANRDGQAFEEAEAFNPERNQEQNLLFGAGIHACPAAPLARMELRVVLEELLKKTSDISLSQDTPPVKAQYPESGNNRLYLQLK
ncbi:cytochrome P450 [Halalkalibaculum sp. DA384]|uniref:cytochrome P450 n=1 Tax=Halalkalibaculum sp. DA384 TaxID=3373606 RepID=UPI0037540232